MTCLFCKIYESQKQNIIYETEDVFVIHDRFPVSRGHMLVIPKKHGEYLHSYSASDLSKILPVVKHVVEKCNMKKYNLVQNNGHIQEIFHLHFHVVPYESEERSLKIECGKMKMSDEEYTLMSDGFKRQFRED